MMLSFLVYCLTIRTLLGDGLKSPDCSHGLQEDFVNPHTADRARRTRHLVCLDTNVVWWVNWVSNSKGSPLSPRIGFWEAYCCQVRISRPQSGLNRRIIWVNSDLIRFPFIHHCPTITKMLSALFRIENIQSQTRSSRRNGIKEKKMMLKVPFSLPKRRQLVVFQSHLKSPFLTISTQRNVTKLTEDVLPGDVLEFALVGVDEVASSARVLLNDDAARVQTGDRLVAVALLHLATSLVFLVGHRHPVQLIEFRVVLLGVRVVVDKVRHDGVYLRVDFFVTWGGRGPSPRRCLQRRALRHLLLFIGSRLPLAGSWQSFLIFHF